MTNDFPTTKNQPEKQPMPTATKSVPKSRSGQPTKTDKATTKRKTYSARFKLDAVQMISETDPCFRVAKRLGLPLQTLHNWHVAYRDGSATFSDAVRLTPEEKEWVLDNVERRLNELNQRADTARNRSETALLNRLKMKIDMSSLR